MPILQVLYQYTHIGWFNIWKNEIDEYLDIRRVLKAREKNDHRKEKLSDKYTDIILVFDFEPHVDVPQFEKIEKMLKFFNDSTINGKLYINYPMMQSCRHIKCYPEEDIEFKDRIVYKMDCSKYKDIVNNESVFKNIHKYDYPRIMKIIGYHLKKANYILNNQYIVPDIKQFNKIDLNRLYKIQCKNNDEKEFVYVLNTFVFNIIEYNPKVVIEKIKEFE